MCGEACGACNLETLLDETPEDPLSDDEVARVMGSILRLGIFEELLAACESAQAFIEVGCAMTGWHNGYAKSLNTRLLSVIAKAKGQT